MNDAARELAARRAREDDATAPFVLERAPEQGTGPTPESAPRDSGLPSDEVPIELVTPATPDPGALPLDRGGRRAARLVTQALVLDALLLLGLAGASVVRISRADAGVPDLLVGGLALVLSLPCLLGARSLWRLGRGSATEDAHHFAQGIAHLRGIFVLKATVLFSALGLGCFAFSLIASLLALL